MQPNSEVRNPLPFESDPEYIDLLNYLIDRTKDVRSPMDLKQLAREYKEKRGSSQLPAHLYTRITFWRTKVWKMDTLDNDTKVKMMFALGGAISRIFLREIQKDALVEMDEYRRITKYKSNDKHLELEGVHTQKSNNQRKDMEEREKMNGQDDPAKTPESNKRRAEEDLSPKRTRDSSPSPVIVPLNSAPVCSIPTPKEPSPRPPEDPPNPTEDEIQVILKAPAPVKLECLEEPEEAQTPQIQNPITASSTKAKPPAEPAQPGSQENPKTILRIPESNKRPAEEVLSSNSTSKRTRNSSPSPIIVPLNSAPVDTNGQDQDLETLLMTPESTKRSLYVPSLREPYSRPPEDPPNPTEDDIQVTPKPPGPIKREEPERRVTTNCAVQHPIDWESDPEYADLFHFLVDRTKDVRSPQDLTQLAREYKEKGGSSQLSAHFYPRITYLRGKVWKMDTIDKDTKVKMMFALSGAISRVFLKEIQTDALVEMDENRRITKYTSNDKHLELEGVHTPKSRNERKEMWMQELEEREKMSGRDDPAKTLKTPESNKRRAEEEEADSSPKRTRNSSPSPIIEPLNSAPVCSSPTPREPSSRPPEDPPEDEIQVIPKPPAPIKREEPEEPVEIQTDRAETPRIKFLEAIQSLVLTLDTPTLSPLLQVRIQRKIRESSNKLISNDELSLALELLVTRMTNHSVLNLTTDSLNLCNFLCYLKTVILSFKLGGLADLLEKINKRIKDPSLKNKSIPVAMVGSALRDTLNNLGI